jgi:hypothetical protein
MLAGELTYGVNDVGLDVNSVRAHGKDKRDSAGSSDRGLEFHDQLLSF